MSKRFFALLLVLCLVLPVAALADITYPIDTDLTITVWMPLDAGNSQVYTNMGDNEVYQEYQKVTGVKINFVHPTYGAEKEGFSTMIAGDKLPDVITEFASYYTGGLLEAYEDGMIYDLAPYLEEYAPDYYALVNQSSEIRREFYTEDDNMLAFAAFRGEPTSRADCLVVRADWCKEFGIDPAELKTFDDLEKYFQAVKDNKPDVIPFLSSREKVMDTLGIGYNVVESFMVVDGKVQHYSNTQGFHDFLARLNSWYEKGYLGIDFGTVSNSEARKLFAAGQTACMVCAIGNAWADAKAAGIEIAKPPFTAVNVGDPVHVYRSNNVNSGLDTVITTSLDEKNVPIVVQMLNFAYTEDGTIFSNWGPEGITWNWVDGERKHADWVINNPNYTTSITHNMCRMHYWPRLVLDETTCSPNLLVDETAVYLRKLYMEMENWDADWKMPDGVTLTVDENSERAKYMTDVNTYIGEMRMRFITGELNLDSDWDAYVKQLSSYGLDKAIEITQAAYDRYVSR